ncbi:PREDICTED: zinc finger protein 383 [Drosophila arizonae]|uniref:Zinc finger protein 383 n=1 Tax=Drosophila arizonae TaxID=7263 RepID=A0ABM1PBN5_DROAR|nr:PREDICTED: zinc finger protein 383 [Drosophila arizonae]
MEICGSILTNSNYTIFQLKCMYCPIESNLQDWPQFVRHTRQAHPFDDADGSLSDQCENEVECPKVEPDEPYEVSMDIKEENHTWHQDDEEFYFTDDALKQEVDPQSLIENDSHMSPTHANGVESNEESRYIDEKEYESQEMDYMQKVEEDTSDYSDNYIDDEDIEDDYTDSDDEPDAEKPKSRRTNPMALKRKLKISFTRQNLRVLHFIDELKKHPCLWNPNDKFFKTKMAENEAYTEIIAGMDKKVNVLFTESELKKSLKQLFKEYTMATQKASEGQLTEVAARYLRKCKFLSIKDYSGESDVDDESKSDVIQLNFKEINHMTTTFIETYASFPVLYDSSVPTFKSLDARTQAYIEIAQMLAPEIHVNETEVYMAIMRLRKWTNMTLRRVKSKELRRACTKSELHYLQLCSFLPPKSESFVITCELCNKRFFLDYSLRAHMVKVHDVGELPFLCSQCPRRFDKAHDMERHKLRQHCEKLLKCEYCDSTFSMKTDLTVHTRVHTGEKPFVCELCGKSFRLKLLLDYHINGFHLNLRPFECDICKNTYRKRVQLKNHMKGHLNIKDKKCEKCGAAFSCPTSLSRHRRTCCGVKRLKN